VMASARDSPAQCVDDIDAATFVALRFGSHVANTPKAQHGTASSTVVVGSETQMTPEDHYRACIHETRDGVLPIVLGICCARWCPEEALWHLRSYEIGLWPGEDSASEASKRRLETSVGGKGARRWSSQLASSAQWAMSAIHNARVPIVVHGGLSDVVQTYEKFVGELPATSTEFGRRWLEFCPLLFDVACMQRDAVLQPLDLLNRCLASVSMPPGAKLPFKELGIYTKRASSPRLGLVVGSSREGVVARSAMAIAEIYLLTLSSLGSSQLQVAEPNKLPVRPQHAVVQLPGSAAKSSVLEAPETPRRQPKFRDRSRSPSQTRSKRRRLASNASTTASEAERVADEKQQVVEQSADEKPRLNDVAERTAYENHELSVALSSAEPLARPQGLQANGCFSSIAVGRNRPISCADAAVRSADALVAAVTRFAETGLWTSSASSNRLPARAIGMEVCRRFHNQVIIPCSSASQGLAPSTNEAGSPAKSMRLDLAVKAKILKRLTTQRRQQIAAKNEQKPAQTKQPDPVATLELARLLWAA